METNELAFIDQPGSRDIYDAGSWAGNLPGIITAAALVALAATLLLCLRGSLSRTAKFWILAFWLIVPPAWFSFEFHYIWDDLGRVGTFELLKYSHDVGGKLWAGVVALVAAVLWKTETDVKSR